MPNDSAVVPSLPAPPGDNTRWIAGGMVIAFVAVVSVAGFALHGEQHLSNTKFVAGLLTLLGALASAAVTAFGLLLKNSIERRTARLAEASERSRQQLAEQSEKSRQQEARDTESRLRLETTIKAVELMATTDGTSTSTLAKEGGLIVLASPPLQQLDLALALLDEHWTHDTISPAVAVWIIDQALTQTATPYLQGEGASLLRHKARLLITPDGRGFQWPFVISTVERLLAFPDIVRTRVLLALIEAVVYHPPRTTFDSDVISHIGDQLYGLFESDPNPQVRGSAALAVDAIAEWFEANPDADPYFMIGANSTQHTRMLDEVRGVLSCRIEYVFRAEEAVERLRREWGLPIKKMVDTDDGG